MKHVSASLPIGAQVEAVLSTDNQCFDRASVMNVIRRAAMSIGLKSPVIATLDTLLSCLPPKRNHHIVFASNQTLAFRRNGISERTLRRHFSTLEALGLIARHDSPNGKRYSKHSASTASIMRFGFDLAPLFRALTHLTERADQQDQENEHLAFLRTKLRAIASRVLHIDPQNKTAAEIPSILRRKLSIGDLDSLIYQLEQLAFDRATPVQEHHLAEETAGNDSQNVRHHQKSKKEDIKIESSAIEQDIETCYENISIPTLLSKCPAAAEFALDEIKSIDDIIAHADRLAPMMRIDASSYNAAIQSNGAIRTALTVWLMASIAPRIKRFAPYFRSLTNGQRRSGFEPWSVILRLDTSSI
ncbi:plasmid replication protein RepC [Paracoccus aestuariivivens]|uniref:Replication protein C n=1 Tax=Paracoccus aestuariivivens TaxID=1820333 RepID=A0A6L6JH78_9RHOB|nr:plasmid replication protein RepC [Paracoccus aestuariivivens]MTH79907.1 replication protein C [Paracoccus aestuariivivens]